MRFGSGKLVRRLQMAEGSGLPWDNDPLLNWQLAGRPADLVGPEVKREHPLVDRRHRRCRARRLGGAAAAADKAAVLNRGDGFVVAVHGQGEHDAGQVSAGAEHWPTSSPS